MTYITKYLRSVEDIKKELEEYPENIKYYMKYQGFTGDSDSIDFINLKIKEYINKENENTKN